MCQHNALEMIRANDSIPELSILSLKHRFRSVFEILQWSLGLNTNPEGPLIVHKIACEIFGLSHVDNK